MIQPIHICAFCEKLPAMGVRSCCGECWTTRDELRAKLATARAVAVEEVVKECEKRGYLVSAMAHLRAIAPLDPSLIAVPREVLEKAREAGIKVTMLLTDARITGGGLCSAEMVTEVQDEFRSSIAELDSLVKLAASADSSTKAIRALKLVEHDPAADAVVRAARKLTDAFCLERPDEDEVTELTSAVAIAVAAYEKKKAKK